MSTSEGKEEESDAMMMMEVEEEETDWMTCKARIAGIMKQVHVPEEEGDCKEVLNQILQSLCSKDDDLNAEMIQFMATFALKVGRDVDRCEEILVAGSELLSSDCDMLIALANFEDEVRGRGDKAESIYRKCLAIDPQSADACQNLGALLVERAKRAASEDVRIQGLKEAVDVLSRAQGSGYTSYNLACAFALLKDASSCELHLSQAAKFGRLPPAHAMRQDPDLKYVSESTDRTVNAWFDQILKAADANTNETNVA